MGRRFGVGNLAFQFGCQICHAISRASCFVPPVPLLLCILHVSVHVPCLRQIYHRQIDWAHLCGGGGGRLGKPDVVYGPSIKAIEHENLVCCNIENLAGVPLSHGLASCLRGRRSAYPSASPCVAKLPPVVETWRRALGEEQPRGGWNEVVPATQTATVTIDRTFQR